MSTDDEFDAPADGAPIDTQAMDDMVFALQNLVEVLELENAALATHDASLVSALYDNKVALTRLFGRSFDNRSIDACIEGMDEDNREAMRALVGKVNMLAARNARMLEAEMEACSLAMNTVATAIQSANRNELSYSSAGRFDSPSNGQRNSLTINSLL